MQNRSVVLNSGYTLDTTREILNDSDVVLAPEILFNSLGQDLSISTYKSRRGHYKVQEGMEPVDQTVLPQINMPWFYVCAL